MATDRVENFAFYPRPRPTMYVDFSDLSGCTLTSVLPIHFPDLFIYVSFDNVSAVCDILIDFLMKYDACQPFSARSTSPRSQQARGILLGLGFAKLAELIENDPDFAAHARSCSPCAQGVATCIRKERDRMLAYREQPFVY
jgi:hypothetical protein